MRKSYETRVDPATIVQQLCLCADSKCAITSEDVVEALFAARGSRDKYPQCLYRIESIKGVNLGLLIDEARHEIDIEEYVLIHGSEAVTKAWGKARELTLEMCAKAGEIKFKMDL